MKNGYIFIANNIFETLFAISEDEQANGLMNKSWPPPIMTFFYNTPKVNKFWMHKTPSPLDIVFCCNNKITEICKGEPFSTSIIGTNNPSDLIIELPYGTVESTKIKLGHSVGIISPNHFELQRYAKMITF